MAMLSGTIDYHVAAAPVSWGTSKGQGAPIGRQRQQAIKRTAGCADIRGGRVDAVRPVPVRIAD